MTPPIRWIERETHWDIERVLQYQTDTGEWVDVPVVGDGG